MLRHWLPVLEARQAAESMPALIRDGAQLNDTVMRWAIDRSRALGADRDPTRQALLSYARQVEVVIAKLTTNTRPRASMRSVQLFPIKEHAIAVGVFSASDLADVAKPATVPAEY